MDGKMNYIKVSNLGTFDVPMAVNLLGASVKSKEDAIGMFGSGLKYALAQAMRENCNIHIASGEHIYKVITKPISFKDKHFDKVYLLNIHTKEEFETPITTDFGKENWIEKWYIYREIVCNSMDEDGYKLTVVENIRRSSVETSIYLSMVDFEDIYNDHKKYFVKKKHNWVRPGEGIVFKKGVQVGRLEHCFLDFQFEYVTIDESRKMDDWSARSGLSAVIKHSKNVEVWKSFFSSTIANEVDLNITEIDVCLVIRRALKQLHGKFAICPLDDHIIHDLRSVGTYPMVVSDRWKFPDNILPTFRDYLDADTETMRKPNEEEQEMIDWGMFIAQYYGMVFRGEFFILTDNKMLNGLANFMQQSICLNEEIFSDKKQFLKTLMHEIGHIDSGKKDWERGFADYFIDKIVGQALNENKSEE
jgi:hypothetical protein